MSKMFPYLKDFKSKILMSFWADQKNFRLIELELIKELVIIIFKVK